MDEKFGFDKRLAAVIFELQETGRLSRRKYQFLETCIQDPRTNLTSAERRRLKGHPFVQAKRAMYVRPKKSQD